MKYPVGGGNGKGRMKSDWRNMNIPPGFHREPVILQDSIQKIGINPNRRRMTDRYRINGREYLRWCFMANTWKYILQVQNVYQDPVLNTKEADVAHWNGQGIRRV